MYNNGLCTCTHSQQLIICNNYCAIVKFYMVCIIVLNSYKVSVNSFKNFLQLIWFQQLLVSFFDV